MPLSYLPWDFPTPLKLMRRTEKPLFTNDSSFIREIWNIYKKDEDYRNVVWDKAVVINSTKYDLYSESRLTHIIIKK